MSAETTECPDCGSVIYGWDQNYCDMCGWEAPQ